jgi:phosphomannomutase
VKNNSEFCVSSFDGDGDRLILSFYKNDVFHLIDGDKITTLLVWL